MILAKDIVTEEIKSLHEKSLPVELPIGQDDVKTLYEMLAYLINSQDDKKAAELNLRPGVGLAAPQIGVNKCMFVVFATDEEGIKHTLLVVNPKIIKTSNQMVYLNGGEGCLSVQRETCGVTPRYKEIKADCYLYNLKLNKLERKIITLRNYLAIVFQHEYDHLFGTLYVDKMMNEDEAKQKHIYPLWEEED